MDAEVDSVSEAPAGRTRFGGQEYIGRQISTQYEKVLSNDSNFPVTVCLP